TVCPAAVSCARVPAGAAGLLCGRRIPCLCQPGVRGHRIGGWGGCVAGRRAGSADCAAQAGNFLDIRNPPEGSMIAMFRASLVLLLTALAAAQEPKRQPDVIFVPTAPEAVAKMLEMAEVDKNDLVYDLGCGD